MAMVSADPARAAIGSIDTAGLARRGDAVPVERFEGGYRITGLRRGRPEQLIVLTGCML